VFRPGRVKSTLSIHAANELLVVEIDDEIKMRPSVDDHITCYRQNIRNKIFILCDWPIIDRIQAYRLERQRLIQACDCLQNENI
jgi:hypothetical protein